jgi:hypothetical protein
MIHGFHMMQYFLIRESGRGPPKRETNHYYSQIQTAII